MIKFILSFIVLIALVTGGYFLAQYPVPFEFQTMGYAGKTSLGFAGLLILLASFLFFLFWRLLDFFFRIPKILRRRSERKRQEKGLAALENTLIASAGEEKKKAQKEALNVTKYLKGNPALTSLLTAQIAESNQQPDLARHQYEALLTDPKTELSARRGLAIAASRQGRFDEAIHHAEKAYESKVHPDWAFQLLLRTEIAQGYWKKALNTLEQGQKNRQISSEIAQRRAAVLLTALAVEQRAEKDKDSAQETFLQAIKKAPGFAPAAVFVAELLQKKGETGKAARILENAWSGEPHPALALAYRDLKEEETPKAQRKRLLGLAKLNKTHRETQILNAEQALAVKDLPVASEILETLVLEESPVSSRLCGLKAQLAMLEKHAEEAWFWIQKSISAPIEPDWSDLDPKGSAFSYTIEDWKRMVYHYGDEGTLLHPRYERSESVLPVSIPGFEQNLAPVLQAIESSPEKTISGRKNSEKKAEEFQNSSIETFPEEKASKKKVSFLNRKTVEKSSSVSKVQPVQPQKKQEEQKESKIEKVLEDTFRQPDDPGIEGVKNKKNFP